MSVLLVYMQERTLKIIEQAPIGIITFSADGEIDYLNQNFRKFDILYHFETSSLIGSNIFGIDIFPHVNIKEELKELLEGFPFEKEIKQITANDHQTIELIVKGTPLVDKTNIVGGMLLIEDIKILSETKNNLGIRTGFIEKAIYHVNDALIITNPKGETQFAEGRALGNLNLINKKITGVNIHDSFEGEIKTLLATNIEKTLIENEATKFEFDVEQNKKRSTFSCKIEPILNEHGAIQFLFFFFNDVTLDAVERKNLSKTVNELTYYKSIIENLKHALFALDNEGRIIYWDDQSEKLFGLDKQKVMGKFFGSTLELFDKRFFENIKKDLETERIWKLNLNIFGTQQNNEIFEAKFSYLNKNHDTIVVMCSNITKKIKEEEELKSGITDYQNILANTGELICKIDSKGIINYANKTVDFHLLCSPIFLSVRRIAWDQIWQDDSGGVVRRE